MRVPAPLMPLVWVGRPILRRRKVRKAVTREVAKRDKRIDEALDARGLVAVESVAMAEPTHIDLTAVTDRVAGLRSWAYRHRRDVFAPLGVAVALVAVRFFVQTVPSGWTWLSLAAALLPLAVVASTGIWWVGQVGDSGRQKPAAVLTVLLGLLWVSSPARIPVPVWPHELTLIPFGAILGAVLPWWPLETTRWALLAAYTTIAGLVRWRRFKPRKYVAPKVGPAETWAAEIGCEGGKLAGSALVDFERKNASTWEATPACIRGKHGTEEVRAAKNVIAGVYGINPDWIEVQGRDDYSRPRLIVTEQATLAGSRPYVPGGVDLNAGTVEMTTYPDGSRGLIQAYVPGRGVKHAWFAGSTGSGKALALDTEIPTPDGWRVMGDLSVGDRVFDERGLPCTVTEATPVQHGKTCYEVHFSDGTTIVADAEHLWVTSTAAGRAQAGRQLRGQPRWSAAQIEHVRDELAKVLSGPDYLISIAQAQARLGLPRGPVRFAAESVPVVPGGVRTEKIRYGAPLAGRAPGYSAQALFKEVLTRIEKVANSHRIVRRDDRPVTTEEIAAAVKVRRAGESNHAVQVARELIYSDGDQDVDLPVPPYTLGAWLGDGTSNSSSITSNDPEIIDFIRADGFPVVKIKTKYMYSIRPGADGEALLTKLRRLNLKGNKHIPDRYLTASTRQRRALLAGLLDTDGYCCHHGPAEFTNTNPRLAHDFLELAIGLGYKATMRQKRCKGATEYSSIAYTVAFTPDRTVFRLARKIARQHAPVERTTARLRYITAVREIPSVPVRCIAVDSPNHLYLASRSCIPTHNTGAVSCYLGRMMQTGLMVLDLADLGETSLPAWVGPAYKFGTTVQEGLMALRRANAVMDARKAWMREAVWVDRDGAEHKGISTLEVTPEWPIYAVLMEEWPEMLGDAEAVRLANRLGKLGRKYGVQIIVVTQPADLKGAFGNADALRMNIQRGGNVLGLSNDSGAGTMVFGGSVKVNLGAIPLDQPGVGYLVGPANYRDVMSRVDYIEDKDAIRPPDVMSSFQVAALAVPGTPNPVDVAAIEQCEAFYAELESSVAASPAPPGSPAQVTRSTVEAVIKRLTAETGGPVTLGSIVEVFGDKDNVNLYDSVRNQAKNLMEDPSSPVRRQGWGKYAA